MGESELDAIRKWRFGTTFLTFEIILTYCHTQLVTQDVLNKENKSFDNIWKREDVYYVDFVLSIINAYCIILSFCNFCSKNIWYFILSYKIIEIIDENNCEYYLQDH